jgi:hypothetical protein
MDLVVVDVKEQLKMSIKVRLQEVIDDTKDDEMKDKILDCLAGDPWDSMGLEHVRVKTQEIGEKMKQEYVEENVCITLKEWEKLFVEEANLYFGIDVL